MLLTDSTELKKSRVAGACDLKAFIISLISDSLHADMELPASAACSEVLSGKRITVPSTQGQ